jgi:hypothetical protein
MLNFQPSKCFIHVIIVITVIIHVIIVHDHNQYLFLWCRAQSEHKTNISKQYLIDKTNCSWSKRHKYNQYPNIWLKCPKKVR